MVHQKSKLSSQDISHQLKIAGIQPTTQRIAVYSYVYGEAKHPTAEQIQSWMKENFPKISLATIYNTLKTFVDAGLLKTLRFPHSEKVIYDDNLSEHYHFLDEKTGELIDIPADQVKLTPHLKENYNIHQVDILFTGTRS